MSASYADGKSVAHSKWATISAIMGIECNEVMDGINMLRVVQKI